MNDYPKRLFKLSSNRTLKLKNILDQYGLKDCQPRKIAQDILNLSNQYQIKSDHSDIWKQQKFIFAYLCYFYPLNSLRLSAVLKEVLKTNLFDAPISHIVDFGSGLGVGLETLLDIYPEFSNKNLLSIDSSTSALDFQRKIFHSSLNIQQSKSASDIPSLKDSLGLFSYSLNELTQTPSWLFDMDHLIIIEPATKFHSRNLLTLRDQLITKGYSILAPCTHQGSCPILTHSKENWCFDRIHTEVPDYLAPIFKQVPIDNDIISFSYLIASKHVKNNSEHMIRITGSTQKEKGKQKQMICRNEELEFLSWLKKYKNYTWIPHGELISLPQVTEKKGNELRVLP